MILSKELKILINDIKNSKNSTGIFTKIRNTKELVSELYTLTNFLNCRFYYA